MLNEIIASKRQKSEKKFIYQNPNYIKTSKNSLQRCCMPDPFSVSIEKRIFRKNLWYLSPDNTLRDAEQIKIPQIPY